MMPIDLDKAGSVNRSGKNIGLTQSGVNVKIRWLEERVKASLSFEGKLLLDYAERIYKANPMGKETNE
jgi:DNA-binding transcriptional LysR family regulator